MPRVILDKYDNTLVQQALPLAAMRIKARQSQLSQPKEIMPLAEWIRRYRRIDGMPLEHYPIMDTIYNDLHDFIIYKKAAQVFMSEFIISKIFWIADHKMGGRGNVLYAYPTQDKLNEFSHARVDKAIEESQHLIEITRGISNVSLKKVGTSYIYFRGAQKRSNLLTMDVDAYFLDEYDEMLPNVLSLADKRLGSSRLNWRGVLSTPTYMGVGIDELWNKSDQRWYVIPCNHCNWKQPLVWEQVDIDRVVYLCERCHLPMNRFVEGEWIATESSNIHGYYINKLYSPRADLQMMVDASLSTNPIEIQEFHNSDLGMAYTPEGASITSDDLDACVNDLYEDVDLTNLGPTYMGVDVGTMLHIDIIERTDINKFRLIFSDEIKDFSGLDSLMHRYNIKRALVDAMPETREARAFQERFGLGRVSLCRYIENQKEDYKYIKDTGEMHVKRTFTMDTSFNLIFERRLELPFNARYIGGRMKSSDRFGLFYQHMMAPNRIMYKDSNENLRAKYDEGGHPDHHAHAYNMSFIASQEDWFTRWVSMKFMHIAQNIDKTVERVYGRKNGEVTNNDLQRTL